MPSKYSPLEEHLRNLPASQREVTLYETEGNHVNKRAWANAGWHVEAVSLSERWVRFSKK